MNDQPLDRILVLARISILVALRRETALKSELQNALQHGFDATILRETILQTYLFAGYASTINALIVFNELAPSGTSCVNRMDRGKSGPAAGPSFAARSMDRNTTSW